MNEEFQTLLSLADEAYFLQRRARIEDVLNKWDEYTKISLSPDEKKELILSADLTPGSQIGAVMSNRRGLVCLMKEYFLKCLEKNPKRNQSILQEEANTAWKLFVESQKKMIMIK